MDERVIRALKNPDPEIRRKAIVALGKAQDPDALPYLARVAKSDDDDDLRELARKAGVYIRKSTSPQQEVLMAAPEAPAMPERKPISKAAKDQAAYDLDKAFDAEIKGDANRAMQLLQKAVRGNPELTMDNTARSLAESLTGQPADVVLDAMVAGPRLRGRGGGARAGSAGGGDQLTGALMIIAGLLMIAAMMLPWLVIRLEASFMGETTSESISFTGLDLIQNVPFDDVDPSLGGVAQVLSLDPELDVALVDGQLAPAISAYVPGLSAVIGLVIAMLGFFAVIGRPVNNSTWILSLVLVLILGGAAVYYYLDVDGFHSFFELFTFGMADLGDPISWLGLGFWMMAGGMGLQAMLSVFGLTSN